MCLSSNFCTNFSWECLSTKVVQGGFRPHQPGDAVCCAPECLS